MEVLTLRRRAPYGVISNRHGGNLDIRLLTQGSKLHLPVQTDGALFYTGDFHVPQVVDLVKGVHCRTPKADLAGLGEDGL